MSREKFPSGIRLLTPSAYRVRVAMEQECTLRLQTLSTLRSSYRIRQSHLGRAKDEAHPASNAQLKQTDNVPTY